MIRTLNYSIEQPITQWVADRAHGSLAHLVFVVDALVRIESGAFVEKVRLQPTQHPANTGG